MAIDFFAKRSAAEMSPWANLFLATSSAFRASSEFICSVAPEQDLQSWFSDGQLGKRMASSDKQSALLWGLDPRTRKKLILSHQEARLRKRWLQVEQELAASGGRDLPSSDRSAPKRKRRSLFPDDPDPDPSEDLDDHQHPMSPVERLGIDPAHLADLTFVYSTLGTGYKDAVPLPPKALLKTLYESTHRTPFYDVDTLSCEQVIRLSDQAWMLDRPDGESEHKKFARQKQIAIFEQEHELAFIEKLRMVKALEQREKDKGI